MPRRDTKSDDIFIVSRPPFSARHREMVGSGGWNAYEHSRGES
jgi:hypothetical protein